MTSQSSRFVSENQEMNNLGKEKDSFSFLNNEPL